MFDCECSSDVSSVSSSPPKRPRKQRKDKGVKKGPRKGIKKEPREKKPRKTVERKKEAQKPEKSTDAKKRVTFAPVPEEKNAQVPHAEVPRAKLDDASAALGSEADRMLWDAVARMIPDGERLPTDNSRKKRETGEKKQETAPKKALKTPSKDASKNVSKKPDPYSLEDYMAFNFDSDDEELTRLDQYFVIRVHGNDAVLKRETRVVEGGPLRDEIAQYFEKDMEL